MPKRNEEKNSRPGRLRIVAGIWRSRLLQIAVVPGLRPTPARIRETLFNWLAPRINGSRCLDLCAGTGALGIEALSRGAAHCVFVEKSAPAVATLRANLATLKANGTSVLAMDARDYLQQQGGGPFDIVFLDPPFADGMLPLLCRLLESGTMLTNDARIYIEEDRAAAACELPPSWQVLKTANAGNVRYSLVDTGTRASRTN